jgi:uncharacterized membrane protein
MLMEKVILISLIRILLMIKMDLEIWFGLSQNLERIIRGIEVLNQLRMKVGFEDESNERNRFCIKYYWLAGIL